MPMMVRVKSSTGEVVAEVNDVRNVITALVDENPRLQLNLAKYIDPYADTTFNSLQVRDLIRDLEKLAATSKNVADRQVLRAVISLAQRCEEDSHSYLTFYGD